MQLIIQDTVKWIAGVRRRNGASLASGSFAAHVRTAMAETQEQEEIFPEWKEIY
jgi:hypothetical protein